MSLTTRTNGQFAATFKANSLTSLETVTASFIQPLALFLDNGSGAAGFADQVYSDDRLLHAGESHTFDMATRNGAEDPAGNPVSMAYVKGFSLVNGNGTESNELICGGAPAGVHGWTGFSSGTISVPGGGGFYFFDAGSNGYPVSSSDLFKIVNTSGDDIDYRLLVVGASA